MNECYKACIRPLRGRVRCVTSRGYPWVMKSSLAHIEDEKKELVREVHTLARLGVQLVDSTKGGVMFHNGFESSFVMDVKSKQDLDPLLV